MRAYLKGKGDALMKDNKTHKINVITFGVNKYGDKQGRIPGVHAEHDAILKLPFIKKKNKLENINILILRFSKNGNILMSKPCINCINNMINIPIKKGYKINNIFYSENDGSITKTTLRELNNQENKHYSKFFRKERWNKVL